ncbi:ABC transporter permease [Taibaiella koreensis]|uniref:ABC transporter permease n=1 Tax=Taibaiella koreensis TaxID=1268548 RepID=UPI000E599313|nr:ABC transporter permease [Taibaiella koreensis]
MNKTLIIIKREYLTRVRKRSFIVLTLLIPFLFIGLAALTGLIAVGGSTGDKKIAVLDNSGGVFEKNLKASKHVHYVFMHGTLDSLKHNLDKKKYDALLYIPGIDKDLNFQLLYNEQIGITTEARITDDLNDIVRNERMKAAGISSEQLKVIEAESISLKVTNIQDGKESSNATAMIIGYACGFLLYMFMLFYGMSVMRSVMEEKTNRIAEIIVSSVRPFQLMLGKIIGVALVGLTQVLIWIVLFGLFAAIGIPMMTGGMAMQVDPASMNEAASQATDSAKMMQILHALQGTNWWLIAICFLFYFLGGYFLYAALFAAVGSLVNEDPQESGQYTLPITIPIILGFVMMSSAIGNPNSGIAIFGSIFPLTSPIVMMARLPFGVAADHPEQLIASMLCLVGGFFATTWMAGKIYRTGILMYGKKISLKEAGKWLMRK